MDRCRRDTAMASAVGRVGVAVVVPILSLLVSPVLGFHPVATIKIGYLSPDGRASQSSEAASFLTAVSVMNSDPLTYLGNASLSVEPHIVFSTTTDLDSQIGGLRAMEFMTAGMSTFRPHVVLGNIFLTPIDVDIVVLGGGTSYVTSVTPIAEFNGKPIIAFEAQGDVLSDKV